ncbi:phosphotransferase [bacterium]|nr:phosphotransferase [bacterium]
MTKMENIIHQLLKSQNKIPDGPFRLTQLAGEASLRLYYRLTFDNGTTLIIMKLPQGFSSPAEEITKTTKQIDEYPFINIQKYLKNLEIPVPEIYAYSANDGILILEDLGDRTLEMAIKNSNNEMLLFFYSKCAEVLADMQHKTLASPNDACIAYSRKFDEDLLFWEFNHFLEYGLDDRLGKPIATGDKYKLIDLGKKLVGEITKLPYGFTHRDFQSRNIMVHEYNFRLIDFQDALIGPVVYDLVALLRDSYIALNLDQIRAIQQSYLKNLKPIHPYYNQQQKLERDFDLLTIQRKLKDAGRFQFIKTVRKNPNFLVHVPSSLAYVKAALERVPDYKEIAVILQKYLPEFA